MSQWNDPHFQALFLSQTPLIDVRAPVEYAEGAMPNSINLPLMNNEERHQVGLCYKESGQEAAIKLGHALVGGVEKEARIQAWLLYLAKNPKAQVYCFRGGLRSQISCQWITEAGVERRPIPGGYKRMRQFFLSWLNDAPLPILTRIGGLTGSGKTDLLLQVENFIDLEGLANHRGSAFGSLGDQPSQTTFENHLAYEILHHSKKAVVEDESVLLGKLILPTRFYKHLRNSEMVLLKIPTEKRVENIFRDYVKHRDVDFFIDSIGFISRRLGGLKSSQLIKEMERAFSTEMILENHSNWITDLLVNYYDPLYYKDLKINSSKIVFEGSASQIKEYLSCR
ncbi:MAG: tRNA 2-selenouridine(34) synthase MnmH [Bacteriovoracaceae bacterium]|nr:tRNA 2-selenouridine(34) synthase MnmH [Bacteriovoracaceae bacterium]